MQTKIMTNLVVVVSSLGILLAFHPRSLPVTGSRLSQQLTVLFPHLPRISSGAAGEEVLTALPRTRTRGPFRTERNSSTQCYDPALGT